MSLSRPEFKAIIERHHAKLVFLESKGWRWLYAYEWDSRVAREELDAKYEKKLETTKNELIKMLDFWDELNILLQNYIAARKSNDPDLYFIAQEFNDKAIEIEKYLSKIDSTFKHYNYIPKVDEPTIYDSPKTKRPSVVNKKGWIDRDDLERRADKILDKVKPKSASLDTAEIK